MAQKSTSGHRFSEHSIEIIDFGIISAYILADAGYDVFLMNSRGTTYSRNHISKNPDNSSSGFWQFTWFEIGVYDNAAVVDYVLEKMNTDKVYFIGMSQGSTTILVLLSERPEYNDKIAAASLLVPIGYMKRLHESMKHLDFLMPLLQVIMNIFALSHFDEFVVSFTIVSLRMNQLLWYWLCVCVFHILSSIRDVKPNRVFGLTTIFIDMNID